MPRPARRLLGVLAAALVVVAAAAGPAHALDEPRLRAQLSTLHKKLGSRAGALVVDLATGRTIFQRRAGTAFSPASNQKLFTTAVQFAQTTRPLGATCRPRPRTRVPTQ